MTAEILFDRERHLGFITLNRPRALNALTFSMVQAFEKQLELWENDSSIHAVVIRSVDEKAFCAGGDVRWLYENRINPDEQMQFFWHEYRLNLRIHRFNKPYIALMDGLTMGGGVGISLHGSYPVATERFFCAMPETAIGFFPDVGASYLLSQCPFYFGVYLALTGERINSLHALALGLVKHVVPSEHLPRIVADLLKADLSLHAEEQVEHCLKQFTVEASAPLIEEQKQHLINDSFSLSTIEDILSSLESHSMESASLLVNKLAKYSPLSLKVTLMQMQRARRLNIKECLDMDYCLAKHFMNHPNFYEGVRALLIDKDKTPRWTPQTLAEVSDSMVLEYFNS